MGGVTCSRGAFHSRSDPSRRCGPFVSGCSWYTHLRVAAMVPRIPKYAANASTSWVTPGDSWAFPITVPLVTGTLTLLNPEGSLGSPFSSDSGVSRRARNEVDCVGGSFNSFLLKHLVNLRFLVNDESTCRLRMVYGSAVCLLPTSCRL